MKLLLLNGLGADERLLAPQQNAFPTAALAPWIPPRSRETLESYGERMAGQYRGHEGGCLLGVSFGGAVALEMARHLRPKAVFLVASTRRGHSLHFLYTLIKPCLPLLPEGMFPLPSFVLPALAGRFGPMEPAHRKLFLEMIRTVDRSFMRWACEAILKWEWKPAPDVPVFQIHGDSDRIIPPNKVKADRVIPGGGHLINLTHAEEVNAFVREKAADELS